MFEKVNPKHPDKLADRIAGAIVDLAYKRELNPKIAVEVLIGHGTCHIICETSIHIKYGDVVSAVKRIAGEIEVDYKEVPQDPHLSNNQAGKFRCGDNGIFKGVPVTKEQRNLVELANAIFEHYPFDGKYILDKERLIICQSNVDSKELKSAFPNAEVNPIGDWTGGTDVDSGATNRKLGSDMADSVTGGGLHGKDLSKADVSVNIYAFLKAQKTRKVVEISCAIGDEFIDGKPYGEIVCIAKEYIKSIGGFEKFAECAKLESVSILSNQIKAINHECFYRCFELKEINIPSSVTKIGPVAFCQCTSLESIFVPESVTTMDEDVFFGCVSLTIYCEAKEQPASWSDSWNSSNRDVLWDQHSN